MRVLHVYQQFGAVRGGIEDALGDLVGALAPVSEQIILTAGRSSRTTIAQVDGVRVIRAGSFGRYFTPFCPGWVHWLRRLAPDVVHVHLPCPMAELAVLLARPRHLVVSLHNDYVRPLPLVRGWAPFHHAALRQADRVVASSAPYARTSPALRTVKPERIAIIPYGLHLADYQTRPRQADAVRRAVAGPLVVFVGRLCYYKGVEVLLRAARDLPATFHLIGTGPWEARLRGLAAGLRNVRFLGALSEREMIAHLHAADIFTLPSTWRSEAFGLAQLKAMASGTPVVSSDLPGVSWVNQHHVTGLVTPPGDAAALAAALRQLIASPEQRDRMGAAARERARLFTVERMATDFTTLYQGCLDGSGQT